MDVLTENIFWMIFNIGLALLGMSFGLIYMNAKSRLLKSIFLVLWFLFLPNTIYMVTDLQYLPSQFIAANLEIQFFLIVQYSFLIVLSIVTYFIGIKPLEVILKSRFKKDEETRRVITIAANFIIGFAVVLGKVQRTHSWYVFTNPSRVLHDGLTILNSVPLVIAIILFGVLFNLIYFSVKNRILRLKI